MIDRFQIVGKFLLILFTDVFKRISHLMNDERYTSKRNAFSIIFCSQFDVPGWRDKSGSPIIADAICDRIVHDSYRIVIQCEESMRKVFGVDKADA